MSSDSTNTLTFKRFELDAQRGQKEIQLLFRATIAAFFVEVALLLIFSGYQAGLFNSSQSVPLDESQFIEAHVFKVENLADAHLKENRKALPKIEKKEALLSKVPFQGVKASQEKNSEEENKTEAATPELSNHGPVAMYAPAPVIPSFLQNQNLKAYVVIVFFVTAQGEMTPKLLRSSGSQELDAVALKTVGRWQFRPALKEGVPSDSKVSLKILFKVE